MFAMSMASIIMLPVFAVPTVLISIIVPAITVLAVVVMVAIITTPIHIRDSVPVHVALFDVARAEIVIVT